MRDIFPVKFYNDEGFVEYKVEINDSVKAWYNTSFRGQAD